MKRSLSFGVGARSAVVLLVFAIGCAKGSGPARHGVFHRYPIEHGHIQYVYAGDARGSEDLYFDRYGVREARISNFEHLEEHSIRPMNTSTISIDTEVWLLQNDHKRGNYHVDHMMDSIESLPEVPTPEQISLDRLNLESKKIGTDTLLGLSADVWKSNRGDNTLYLWRQLLLKRVTVHPNDSIVLTAISIDTAWHVDTTYFRIPSDYEIIGRPKPQKE